MHRLSTALLLLLGLAIPAQVRADRKDVNWNTNWKFLDSAAEPIASTQSWANIQIPHTWNVQGYRRGPGWYAKTFEAPNSWRQKRVFVSFEAVSLAADVYLNGQQIGHHEGGFTAFTLELSPYLKYGETNELRVCADNSKLGIAPVSADFNFCGGIYRPVHLLLSDKVCISPLDHGSSGVYITSRQVTPQNASIEVKTLVSNGQNAQTTPQVTVEIFDASGKKVATANTRPTIAAGQTASVVQTLNVESPRLWKALIDPYLYSVRVRVRINGQSDEVRQPLGIRTVGFTPDERCVLNNALYPIRGVNRHQDWKGKAWELTEAEHKTDVALIKELGATAIRLAHYPQSPVFLDLCDREGLLLWEEIPVVNRILEGEHFSENAKEQLTEMILQGYNHPSIMMWGLFNEVNQPAETQPEKLIGELSQLVHTLDSTRPSVGASSIPNAKLLNRAPDHLGFNIYPGWYGDAATNYGKRIEDRSRVMDWRRIALSEYGAGASIIQHEEGELKQPKPTGKWHPEEWQTYVHEQAWAAIQDNPHLWGTFVWVMFDFAVDGRNEGDRPGINDKGLVTDDRKTRKDAFFFYKANWNPEPMVYIASRRMTPRKQATTGISVFSNLPEVELLVNGKSQGTAKPDKIHVFRWENVVLAPGKNRIEARALKDGRSLKDQCEWVLETP